MKLSLISALLIFLVPAAWADNNGGLQKGEAPPPPHALDSGYRGTDDARIMTIDQAKQLHDGATFHYAVILLTVAAISLYFRIKPEKSTLLFPRQSSTAER
jgi:uncharacterized protein (TIGR00156 family)